MRQVFGFFCGSLAWAWEHQDVISKATRSLNHNINPRTPSITFCLHWAFLRLILQLVCEKRFCISVYDQASDLQISLSMASSLQITTEVRLSFLGAFCSFPHLQAKANTLGAQIQEGNNFLPLGRSLQPHNQASIKRWHYNTQSSPTDVFKCIFWT